MPLCGVGSVFLSSVFSLVMSQQWQGADQLAWHLCIERMKTDKQTAMIALVCFLMVFAVAAMMIFVMGSDKTTYKSELRQITDKISTPVAYGEKQYGSAQWLKKDEYSKAFCVANLRTKKGILPELMRQGKDDLTFLRPKEDFYETEKNQTTSNNGTNNGTNSTDFSDTPIP